MLALVRMRQYRKKHFPVDVLSAGGGVSPNMNVNEEIANRANEILSGRIGYEFVHPTTGSAGSPTPRACLAGGNRAGLME